MKNHKICEIWVLIFKLKQLNIIMAATLIISIVLTTVIPEAAIMIGSPSAKKKTIKVTFESGDGGYFTQLYSDNLLSSQSNASYSSANRTKWVQSFYHLDKDDLGYFTNLTLAAEEAEKANQNPVWETLTNQANENEDDEDNLIFAGWYCNSKGNPILVSKYKEIYSNVTLKAEWYNPDLIKGDAADTYDMVAIGLDGRTLICNHVNVMYDSEEFLKRAGKELFKLGLEIDSNEMFAVDLQFTKKKQAVTVTLTAPKNTLDPEKPIYVIQEKRDRKLEIIPADMVKADTGNVYKVTFTLDNGGRCYFVNTCNSRISETVFHPHIKENSNLKENEMQEMAEGIDAEGKLNERLLWKFAEGTLTISGTGAMPDWDFNNYETIPWYNFRYDIEKTVIEDGVTTIGNRAFFICTNLVCVDLPDSIISIGELAFNGCSSLTDIKISDNITNIGNQAFRGCDALTGTIPIRRENIDSNLKWELNNRGKLTITGKGKIPGWNIYLIPWRSYCLDIKEVVIDDRITDIGRYAFYQCTELEHIKIPQRVTSIGAGAFWGCSKLTSIELPNTICSIHHHAFYETAISSVDIPESVTFLGQKSFPEKTVIVYQKKITEYEKPIKPTGKTKSVSTENEHGQNYGTYGSVVKSYLYEGENKTFYRAEYASNQVIIEQYNCEDFTFIKSWKIPMELPKFGGFYAGTDAFYLVFGKENLKESDDAEVIRIVKYSKDMRRISSASLYGVNTINPFAHSSLRMDEQDGYLYIRTGHSMYKSDDGKNHQANMTIVIDTENMIFSYYGVLVSIDAVGYASHSFNQFVKIDNKQMIAIDHGDAHPRSVVMTVSSVDDLLDNTMTITLLPIPGNTGDNYTGVSIGGLEYSNSSYLTVGNSVDLDNFARSKTRNVFLSIVNKDDLNQKPEYVWITDYKEGGTYSASTPQLVKISDDLFAVMWEEMRSPSSDYSIPSGTVKVIFVDGKGKYMGSKRMDHFSGSLSDCQPITLNDCVIWYSSNNERLVFYDFPAKFPDSPADIEVTKTIFRNSNSSDNSNSNGSSSGSGGSGGGGSHGGTIKSSGQILSGTGPGSYPLQITGAYIYSGVWVPDGQYWKLSTGQDQYAKSQWALINGKWYVFNQDGRMLTGWQNINNRWYMMNNDGAMLTGWMLYAGKWYYLMPDGAMSTGWSFINNHWYCFSADGAMYSSTVTPDGYLVNINGEWIENPK